MDDKRSSRRDLATSPSARRKVDEDRDEERDRDREREKDRSTSKKSTSKKVLFDSKEPEVIESTEEEETEEEVEEKKKKWWNPWKKASSQNLKKDLKDELKKSPSKKEFKEKEKDKEKETKRTLSKSAEELEDRNKSPIKKRSTSKNDINKEYLEGKVQETNEVQETFPRCLKQNSLMTIERRNEKKAETETEIEKDLVTEIEIVKGIEIETEIETGIGTKNPVEEVTEITGIAEMKEIEKGSAKEKGREFAEKEQLTKITKEIVTETDTAVVTTEDLKELEAVETELEEAVKKIPERREATHHLQIAKKNRKTTIQIKSIGFNSITFIMISYKVQKKDSFEDTAAELCRAASRGELETVKSLIEDKRVNLNVGDYDNRTALHLVSMVLLKLNTKLQRH